MNSLESVLTTIRHEEPDRVPVGEWGIDHDHTSRILGRHTFLRNRKDTTLALWEGRRDEVVSSSIRDYIDLVEALDLDVVPVGLVPPKVPPPDDPPRPAGDGLWRNAAGDTWRYSASDDSIVPVGQAQPAREIIPDSDAEQHCRKLLTLDDSQFEEVDAIAAAFGKSRAVVFRGLNPYFPMVSELGGDRAHVLTMTALAPEQITRFSDATVAHNRLLLQRAAGRGIAIAMQATDYGTTTGLMMSPQTVRGIFMPVHKAVATAAVELGFIPFFHSCGRIWEILDDWVDAGLKGYQSVQASAGMDLATVKARYGDRLTLWAGIQCETLVTGTPDDVEREVRASLKVGMPGGGFILGANNSVLYGARTENYLRALKVAREYGVYAPRTNLCSGGKA